MRTSYEKIIHENLERAYRQGLNHLAQTLPAKTEGRRLLFRAFGKACSMELGGIAFSGRPDYGPRSVLVSLYAAHAQPGPAILEPFRAFKDFPGSMPYQGAFRANVEEVLAPRVLDIRTHTDAILQAFPVQGHPAVEGGDFSLLLYPLPKIALRYVFYLPDEDFSASATCLFSANALSFLPLDGLADVAEHTSKALIDLLQSPV